VGDFRVVKVGNKLTKNGGNVASHFLTADGRVIHSVTGPVSAEVLLDEARWAIEMYAQANTKAPSEQTQFVAWSHQQASWAPASSRDRRVHELLATRPMPPLQSVYQEIFGKILGERVSQAGPRLAQASVRLKYAETTARPILFVLHEGNHWSLPPMSPETRQLMGQCVVIVMPLREAPALSQLTGQPPFEVSTAARPLMVVTQSDCKQLASISGWQQQQLASAMARAWVDSMEQNPPTLRALVRAQRLLRKVDSVSAGRAKELTIRVQQLEREAREAEKSAARELAEDRAGRSAAVEA
jgi:hypothetical protein